MMENWLAYFQNPEKRRAVFFLSQAGLVIGGLLYFYVFKKPEVSAFGAREADLRKSQGRRQMGVPDPLAESRKAQPAQPMRLAGISIQGAPHEILGISVQASSAEIQKAYRELMKRYHPDIVGRPGTREWTDAQKIAEALNRAKSEMLASAKNRTNH